MPRLSASRKDGGLGGLAGVTAGLDNSLAEEFLVSLEEADTGSCFTN